MKKLIVFTIFTYALTALSYYEINDVKSFKEECLNNIKFTSPKYRVDCGKNFHHYNYGIKAKSGGRRDTVKISHFNALHPGMGKSRFKDYDLVAKMLSRFDIIAVTELIPSMSDNLETNLRVASFEETFHTEIKKREVEVTYLSKEQRERHSIVRERKINLQKQVIKNMKRDFKRLHTVYKAPGYLKILNSLRALNDGNNWSLIITSKPEGRETNDVKELVGYYYKANFVSPMNTPYCASRGFKNGSKSYACHPQYDRKDLGKDKSFLLSRRPFMASFGVGNFKTTLIAAHSLFDSPNIGEAWKKRFLKTAFGKSSLDDLPTGINKANYARYAELKVTLEFIQKKLRKTKNDVVLLGDFNLESSNKFMNEVIQTWNGAEIFIDEKTSVTSSRFDKNSEPTSGVSSNYDHFIFNPDKTSECMQSANSIDGGVYNFLNLSTRSDLVGKKYKVRTENRFRNGVYSVDKRKTKQLIKEFVTPMTSLKKPILTIGPKEFTYDDNHSLKAWAIIPDHNEMDKYTSGFVEKVLNSQKVNESYYNFYAQTISDHLPIYMNCRID